MAIEHMPHRRTVEPQSAANTAEDIHIGHHHHEHRTQMNSARAHAIVSGNDPGMSLLRFSLMTRLWLSMILSAMIWIAVHWAVQ